MHNYTKEELVSMSDAELAEVAQQFNIYWENIPSGRLIYDILDAQAEQSTRVALKEGHTAAPVGNQSEAEAGDDQPFTPEELAEWLKPRTKRGRPSAQEMAMREKARRQWEAENGRPFVPEEAEEKPARRPGRPRKNAAAEAPVGGGGAEVSAEAVEMPQQAAPSQPKADKAEASGEQVNLKQITPTLFILKDAPGESELKATWREELPRPRRVSWGDNQYEEMARPKFRRFKDDPIVGGGMSAEKPAESTATASERDEMLTLQNETPERAERQPMAFQQPGERFEQQGERSQRTADEEEDLRRTEALEPILCSGVLEIATEGFGFLRSADYNFLSSPDDIYVSPNLIHDFKLRMGDVVEGHVRVPSQKEKFYILTDVVSVCGENPATQVNRVSFEHLTPLFPDTKFRLCSPTNPGQDSVSVRTVDLFAPIGKGQRALIVAQPKTGKTMLMKDLCNAISRNHPETYIMVLLIDERPEEVTDMRRTVKAEVIASTFDAPAAHHVKIAGLVIEKAKRLVESGQDVVIFLDSITRLARAYNNVAPTTGRILSGGVESTALQKPKRFFGAARNIEGGGSLSIIATALIDTGSRMDEVIFEEFKGTGNMELQLDRALANKRIFPAVNLTQSSTRRDDLLLEHDTLEKLRLLRGVLTDMTPVEAMSVVKKAMDATRDNAEFLLSSILN